MNITELNAEVARLKEALNDSEKKLKAAQEEVSGLKATNEELTQRATAAETALTTLKAKHSEAEKTSDAAIQTLKTRNQELETQARLAGEKAATLEAEKAATAVESDKTKKDKDPKAGLSGKELALHCFRQDMGRYGYKFADA